MANCKDNSWYSSSDEDDFKVKSNKKAKVMSDVEEGELSSDNCDELNLEKLFKDEDERNRVLRMTEKEREVEIFKRSVELNDIKSRQKAAKKLNEQKKKQSNQRPMNKKRSLAEVFNGCLSEDESVHSSDNESPKRFSTDDSAMPKKKSKWSPQPFGRQKALDNQKRSQNVMLSQLNENRKQRKEKAEKNNKEDIVKKPNLDSDSSDLEEKNIDIVDRQSIISSSSSEQLNENDEQDEDKVVETLEQLSKIRLSRHKMEKWVHMPFFKDLVKGCFVRVNIGEGPSVVPIYRCAEITEVVETVKIYDFGSTRTNVGLKLKIGKSVTTFRLIFVSNQDFLLSEFESWRRRVVTDGAMLPKLSFIEEKARQIKDYTNFSINDEETMKQVLMSKQRFQKGPVNFAMRKAELTRLKLAAENDGDLVQANKFQDEIDELNLKAEKLERKRTTGIKNISYINQRNREITQNHVEKAIELEIEENREWEKIGGDPFLREPTKPVLNYRKKKQQILEQQKAAAQIKDEQQQKGLEDSLNADASHDFLPSQDNDSSAPKPFPGSSNNAGSVDSPSGPHSSSCITSDQSGSSTTKGTKTSRQQESKININKIHNFELVLDIKEEHPSATGTGSSLHHPYGSGSSLAKLISSSSNDINHITDSIFLNSAFSTGVGSLGNGVGSSLINSNSGGSASSAVANSNNSNQNSVNRRVLNLQDYKRRKGLI